MLLRDLDGAKVAADVASWILDRGAPLPSRADAADTRRAVAARRQRLNAGDCRLRRLAPRR